MYRWFSNMVNDSASLHRLIMCHFIKWYLLPSPFIALVSSFSGPSFSKFGPNVSFETIELFQKKKSISPIIDVGSREARGGGRAPPPQIFRPSDIPPYAQTLFSWISIWIYLKSQIKFWNLKISFKSEIF